MGPSGAGKTSLLNCIAGITQEGEISGTIKVNGKQVPQKVLRAMSGFVHQDDVFDEKMTVCEGIFYLTCSFKNGNVSQVSKSGRKRSS